MLRIILPIILLAIVAYFSLFRIQEYEQAIVFQFREIQRSDHQPGLHYMIPIINTVKKFEKRLLNLDQEPQRFLTVEKKDVIVDYYAKWFISDVEKFYVATRGGDVDYANGLLGQRINRALRDEFGKRTVQEVVAGERGEILDVVEATTDQLQAELGISIVDVRTKRIDLPEDVSGSVYDRMRAERTRVAKDFRARGEEAAKGSGQTQTGNARSYWPMHTRMRKQCAVRAMPALPKSMPAHSARTRNSIPCIAA